MFPLLGYRPSLWIPHKIITNINIKAQSLRKKKDYDHYDLRLANIVGKNIHHLVLFCALHFENSILK
jgi:hypothetical protein